MAPQAECVGVNGFGPDETHLPRARSLARPARTVFTAANRAALQLKCATTYAGGFPDVNRAHIGAIPVLRVVGLPTLADDHVTDAQVAIDRLGLHRHSPG